MQHPGRGVLFIPMKKYILLFAIFCSSLIEAQLSPGLQTLDVNGRSVDVVTPANYDPAKTYPVIFFLHGLGGNKSSLQAPGVADAGQFIGVYPEGTSSFLLGGGRAWNSLSGTNVFIGNVNDVAHLTNVYNAVSSRLGLMFNANKVFSVGFSNGGSMNLKMVKNTNLFKAVVIGSMSEEKGANGAIPTTATKVPMLFIHGIEDQVVPFNGGQGQFGLLANFEPVRDAVKRWAQYNTGFSDNYQQLEYLGDANLTKYYFREYRDEANKKASVYLYMLPGTPHDISSAAGFNIQNLMTTSLRFFTSPICYGFSREYCLRNNIIR